MNPKLKVTSRSLIALSWSYHHYTTNFRPLKQILYYSEFMLYALFYSFLFRAINLSLNLNRLFMSNQWFLRYIRKPVSHTHINVLFR